MGLRISGKNMDIGESLREQAQSRISMAVAKYFDGGFDGHVTIDRSHGPLASNKIQVECVCPLE